MTRQAQVKFNENLYAHMQTLPIGEICLYQVKIVILCLFRLVGALMYLITSNVLPWIFFFCIGVRPHTACILCKTIQFFNRGQYQAKSTGLETRPKLVFH